MGLRFALLDPVNGCTLSLSTDFFGGVRLLLGLFFNNLYDNHYLI
jgi:hypothetical protein